MDLQLGRYIKFDHDRKLRRQVVRLSESAGLTLPKEIK